MSNVVKMIVMMIAIPVYVVLISMLFIVGVVVSAVDRFF